MYQREMIKLMLMNLVSASISISFFSVTLTIIAEHSLVLRSPYCLDYGFYTNRSLFL